MTDSNQIETLDSTQYDTSNFFSDLNGIGGHNQEALSKGVHPIVVKQGHDQGAFDNYEDSGGDDQEWPNDFKDLKDFNSNRGRSRGTRGRGRGKPRGGKSTNSNTKPRDKKHERDNQQERNSNNISISNGNNKKIRNLQDQLKAEKEKSKDLEDTISEMQKGVSSRELNSLKNENQRMALEIKQFDDILDKARELEAERNSMSRKLGLARVKIENFVTSQELHENEIEQLTEELETERNKRCDKPHVLKAIGGDHLSAGDMVRLFNIKEVLLSSENKLGVWDFIGEDQVILGIGEVDGLSELSFISQAKFCTIKRVERGDQ